MRSRVLLGVLCAWACGSARAEPPAAKALLRPPADAKHYVVESTGGKHGDSWSWTGPGGVRMGRETYNLRGQAFDSDFVGKPGRNGLPAAVTVRGFAPSGDIGETYVEQHGVGRWKSPIDAGSAPAGRGFYVAQSGPIDTSAWLVERLISSPSRTLDLLPGGQAQAVKLTSLEVGSGRTRQTVDLWSLHGIANAPLMVWTDARGKFFGFVDALAYLPEPYANERQRLAEAQVAEAAKEGPEYVRTLVETPAGAVAFTHVRLFDAERARFVADQTVVVADGRITAVGPAKRVRPPKGARVIEGHGMTLIPGLWDCHLHVADDYTGLQELSLGVTSIRDPGNNDALTIDRRTRRAAGQLLFPHVYPSSLIDGKGPYTAQVANVATSQEQAIALVDRAKANGFTGVKFYGTFNPAWLPAAIAEAHKLGLHVHGHIPAGIRPMEAIDDGYDEVTHINWVMMQALPESLLPVDNGIMRFEGPGRYAKDVDLDGPAIRGIVSAMASRHIYSDPTMVAFEGMYVPENGQLSDAYLPFAGTLPPAAERGFRTGGLATPPGVSRDDYRASWAKLVGLLGRMHKAGVPIVAGTDGSGLEIVHELEIYVRAGLTPGEALAAATIVPARLVGEDARTGSIKVGKTADLVLVAGDPSKRIGDLRQTRVVMLEGRLLDADALRRAAGFSGRPR